MNRFQHVFLPDSLLTPGERNVHMARICWPDWEGPKVTDDPEDPAGWASVGSCCVFNETKGCVTYEYCAPLRILEVLEDGFSIRGVIHYHEGHCMASNGEILRLDMSEVWAPTDMIWKIRAKAELAEMIADGKTCDCGALPEKTYGGRPICKPCFDKEMKKFDPPPAKKAAKKTPKKPK